LICYEIPNVLLQLAFCALLAGLAFSDDDRLMVVGENINLLRDRDSLIACDFDLEVSAYI
jgi:hypothetical protein